MRASSSRTRSAPKQAPMSMTVRAPCTLSITAGKPGQQQAHVGALRGQRHRQRGHHVGQPAGLHQRKDLGRDVQDLHAAGVLQSRRSMSRVTSVMPDSVR